MLAIFAISTMKNAAKNIALKLFIALLAIQIINLSIDTADFQPIAATITIGDFNYLNSMTEYISEIIMGDTNAFPEYQKESSSSKSQLVKHISIKLQQDKIAAILFNHNTLAHVYLNPKNENYNFLFFKEINPPPPKILFLA